MLSQNLQESPEKKYGSYSQKFDTRPSEKSPNVALNQARVINRIFVATVKQPRAHIFIIKNGANFLADFPREHAERGLNVYRYDGDGASLLGHLTDDRQDGLRWHHQRR